jgi:hypothetical protein
MTSLEKPLTEFRASHNLKGKGQLAVMPRITRLAMENGACGLCPQRQAAGPSFVPGPGDWVTVVVPCCYALTKPASASFG